MAVVDLAAPDTWPTTIGDAVHRVAAQVRRHVRRDAFACDLPTLVGEATSDDAERIVREALRQYPVAAYHATRLLQHEVLMVREEGLRVLSDDLRERKLRAAQAAHPDLLDESGVNLLRESGPLTWGGGQRRGLAWVVCPVDVDDDAASGLRYLLSAWGGEVIGWTRDSEEPAGRRPAADLVDRLSSVSRPTLVEVAVDVAWIPATQCVWPVAIGQLLGLQGASAEWALERTVPASHVLHLIQPGDERWPRTLAYD